MLEITQRLLKAAEGGTPVLLASIFEAGPTDLVPGARLLIEPTGERMGSLGLTALDDLIAARAPQAFAAHSAETVYVSPDGLSDRAIRGATSVYVEVVEAKPVFVIVGGGHIGRSLCKLADMLDFHVVVIDDREEFANEEALPAADEVICDDFEVALRRLHIDANTSIVMVTRGHKQDELSLRHSLGRGAGYVGMIGSMRRTTAVLSHLESEGFSRAELDRVHTPIGLDIGAETPEEIAVSIMAQVIMLRRGGDGSQMERRRRS